MTIDYIDVNFVPMYVTVTVLKFTGFRNFEYINYIYFRPCSYLHEIN